MGGKSSDHSTQELLEKGWGIFLNKFSISIDVCHRNHRTCNVFICSVFFSSSARFFQYMLHPSKSSAYAAPRFFFSFYLSTRKENKIKERKASFGRLNVWQVDTRSIAIFIRATI